MPLTKAFKSCIALPDVDGAFCLTDKGELVENFMPAHYTDAILAETGSRIANLIGAVDMGFTPSTEFLIRFDGNALYLRRGDGFVVALLTISNPNLAALRVSTNLLCKQIPVDAIRPKPLPEEHQGDHADDETDDFIVGGSGSVFGGDEPERGRPERRAPEPKPAKRKGLFGFGSKPEKKDNEDIWG